MFHLDADRSERGGRGPNERQEVMPSALSRFQRWVAQIARIPRRPSRRFRSSHNRRPNILRNLFLRRWLGYAVVSEAESGGPVTYHPPSRYSRLTVLSCWLALSGMTGCADSAS